jgi:hypothetical protein
MLDLGSGDWKRTLISLNCLSLSVIACWKILAESWGLRCLPVVQVVGPLDTFLEELQLF